MSVSGYNYSIQNDTPNHRVDTSRLTLEVQLGNIITALDHIGTAGDVLTVWFKAQLSAGDHTILTGIVQSHSGDPLPEAVQDVLITNSELNLPVVQKGFPDYSGYPYFGDSLIGTAVAGQTTVFYLAFDKAVRIQGGGFHVEGNVAFGDYMKADMTYLQTPYVVGVFLNKMHTWNGRTWERETPDCALIPLGIYLRMTYVSVAPPEGPGVNIWGWYDLRRVPGA